MDVCHDNVPRRRLSARKRTLADSNAKGPKARLQIAHWLARGEIGRDFGPQIPFLEVRLPPALFRHMFDPQLGVSGLRDSLPVTLPVTSRETTSPLTKASPDVELTIPTSAL